MLNIKPTDRVLEIGSGNRPRRRSNVLVDKFITDNTQRSSGENVLIDERPFVAADALALPFKDKSFDYVITSHILEHVDDPDKFVAELERVASRGYIETPSELSEKIFGWPFHKWTVRCEGDTIVMRKRMEDSPFGNYFHEMYAKDPLFAEFMDSHFDDFYVQYEWRDVIKVRLENEGGMKALLNSNMAHVRTKPRWKDLAISGTRLLLLPVLKLLRHFRKFE
jgi:ubiquinone/menaquinone biosynthesis C-methylase UbiE